MSLSFGVAAASLTAAVFVPVALRGDAGAIVHGIHHAFIVLGVVTVASAAVFRGLAAGDGASLSRHEVGEPG